MKQVVALAALFLAAPLAALFGQEDKPAAGQPVVELPKFVVTDSRDLPPPESWRYATIPGFEILSNASDRATQRLIREFDMFRQALSYVWPVPDRLAQSTSLIICGRGGKFDAFAPAKEGVTLTGISVDTAKASLFFRKGTQAAIIIDLQATTLNVLNVDDSNDAQTGTDSGLISVDHDKQLYREYVRYLMSQSEPRSPAWLEEGLSQILMKMQFDKRWIEFAKLEDPNTISAQAAMVNEINATAGGDGGDGMTLPGAPAEDRDFNAALSRRALVPLDKFFAVKHDSPEAMNPLGNNRWAKQAYAFVHMCLYGFHGKYQKPFGLFLQRSAKEPVTEALFKECFNMTYKQMLMEIRGYCDFTVYDHKVLQPPKKSDPDLITAPPPLALRDATQSEVGRIKGEALVLGGNTKAARTELFAPYLRGERDPNLLAALGLYEKTNGEPDRARKFLDGAFAGKTTRSDANLEIARLRFADATAAPGAAEGRFSAAQVAAVLTPLQIARKQPPPQPAVYELAGDTLLRSATPTTRDEAIFLIEGAQVFPTRFKIVYMGALLAGRANELQAAHALADHGIKYVPDANGKKRFEELKASLPPAPPPPAPAPAAAASTPAPKEKK